MTTWADIFLFFQVYNPFTPKSDQFQISPAASPESSITQVTWMKDDYTTNSHNLTYTFLFKGLGECTFWTWKWKGQSNAREASQYKVRAFLSQRFLTIVWAANMKREAARSEAAAWIFRTPLELYRVSLTWYYPAKLSRLGRDKRKRRTTTTKVHQKTSVCSTGQTLDFLVFFLFGNVWFRSHPVHRVLNAHAPSRSRFLLAQHKQLCHIRKSQAAPLSGMTI